MQKPKTPSKTVKIREPLSRFSKVTENIRVTVTPIFLEEESLPVMGHYMWAYHVQIENIGDETVQLHSRHWHITDGNGHVTEVRGEGVIGEQPVIEPGKQHEYTSSTYLMTPSGIMKGSYFMIGRNDRRFSIEIPSFSLDSPEQKKKPN